ncbi:MAG TPA: glycosyltransferase [Longimicrobium sp.]|jgi:glycosyltransferase involved in cell wall biosynthesis
MKVVIQNNGHVWGGNEKWLATLAAGLLANGHSVVVSCRREGAVWQELARRGIPTSPIRPGTRVDVVRGMRFARWLRRERPDALLLTSWAGIPWGARAARMVGVPRVVVRLGIVRTLPARGRHPRPFRGGGVDALIVNSEEIRAEWVRSAPWFPPGEVHVILNGIVPPPPLPAGERAALRAGLGVAPGTPLIAGVGHVYPRKGFDLLIDALAEVPRAEVVIAGTGPAEESLRARAAALGVAGRVRWAGFRDDVPRLLGACDLFVLSSRNEGMANVMLEAMAAGTPVVATGVSGVRRALDAREGRPPAGWIVPPDDAPALADAIRTALAHPVLARSCAEEASWRIAHWFGPGRMVAEAEAVLAPSRAGVT